MHEKERERERVGGVCDVHEGNGGGNRSAVNEKSENKRGRREHIRRGNDGDEGTRDDKK